MNYGSILDTNFSQFSDDEKLNYGLKIALSRLQTELKRAWYQEPKDFAPKGPETIYKNKLPSYVDIAEYYLIDPFCKVDNVENTSVITNVKVGDILNNSANASGWGFGDTDGSKHFYNAEGIKSVRDNTTNITDKTIPQSGLSKQMFTKYRYWENGLTGKNSSVNGSAGNAGNGTYTDKIEPENSILSYVGGELSSARIWKAYDDNLGENNSENLFFEKLTTFSSPIKIIDPSNVNTIDYTDITKAHPFLEIYIQVPTISTRQSDTQNTSSSGNSNGTDNIGFFNPVLKQSLGDVEGFNYVIRGWAGNTAKWGDLNIETGATNNTNILYFLNNPGFILCYGVKDIENGFNLSRAYPPVISFLKYTGETFANGIISQDLSLPTIATDKDLFIDTSENTIYRFDASANPGMPIDATGPSGEWISIGGGGGGGGGGGTTGGSISGTTINVNTGDSDGAFRNEIGYFTSEKGATGDNSTAIGWDTDASEIYSTAMGKSTTASGSSSTAMGYMTTASGIYSTAMGKSTTASGSSSTAMGNATKATMQASTAMGQFTTASGHYSTAMGQFTTASGSSSTAMGESTTASGNYSTAMGKDTDASGTFSTAMGQFTTASGQYSTAMGKSTRATNECSTAMGQSTTASGKWSTAMGNDTTASGWYSTAMGGETWAYHSHAIAMGKLTTASGEASTAMGQSTTASGINSTAMGHSTRATRTFSTAMGYATKAQMDYATAMGKSTTASGDTSTAMGKSTTASGSSSTAMGESTIAGPGNYSTAMGYKTTASGDKSTAMGESTYASHPNSTAMGYWTRATAEYATAMGRSCTASEYNSTAMGKSTIASGQYSTAMGNDTTASGQHSTAMGYQTFSSNYGSTAMGYGTKAAKQASTAMGQSTLANGNYSTAMGYSTTASGSSSTAMGNATKATMPSSTAMGYSTTALGSSSTAMGESTTAGPGSYSTAMGRQNNASGEASTAMGYLTTASGHASTAMTQWSYAQGDYSTAMGYWTTASASMSIAMGRKSKAMGTVSTAMGYYTTASGSNSTAMGRYSLAISNNSVAIGNKAYAGGNIVFAVGASSTQASSYPSSFTNSYNAFWINTDKHAHFSDAVTSDTIFSNVNADLNLIGRSNITFKAGNGQTNGYATCMTMTQNCLGIGRTDPIYPLEIYSKKSGHTGRIGSNRYVHSTGHGGNHNWGAGTHHYFSCLMHNNLAILGSYIALASDKRIKENITEVPDNLSLQKLRDISCCYYEYKDKMSRGASKVIGFIAQQVREHMSDAVSLIKNMIPNEMRNIENPQWTTLTDASGIKYKLTIPDLSDVSGNTKYKFYVSNDISGDEVEKEISSMENDPKSFIFEEQWQMVFLYGKEVYDFHTLNKQALFTLNFSATQEIDRIQQKEKIKLEEQVLKLSLSETKITSLETKLEEQVVKLSLAETKITSLETQNSNLLARLEAIEKVIETII